MTQENVIKFDEAYMWIEQDSSIHLKAVSAYGDPIELTAREAREIGTALLTLAAQLEAIDARES